MIQRIQSIYMAVAVIATALTLLLSFAHYTIEGSVYVFDGLGFHYSPIEFFIFPIIGNILVSVLLSLVILFSFKNRKRQILLSKINFIVLVLLIVFIFVNFNFIESHFNLLQEEIDYGIGFLLPVVALVAQIMATRAIKADEKLIKSMDRIR